MIKEYLLEKKSKYQNKQEYFKKIGFDVLATDFQEMVDLIEEVERQIDEQTNN